MSPQPFACMEHMVDPMTLTLGFLGITDWIGFGGDMLF